MSTLPVKHTQVPSTLLNTVEIEDGQLIVTSDEAGMYYDAGNTRYQVGSGSSGHTIENQAGTDLTQRTNMQFVDAHLSDDSTNDRTKIEIVKQLTRAQLDALGANTDGIYETTDESDMGSYNSFIIRNQTLTFSNLTATVTDSRVTTSTLLLTYYHDDAVAQAAGIRASVTAASTITFTATAAPSSTVVVDIVCITEGLSAEPSASDISYTNTTSGLSATDVQDAIDELAAGAGSGGHIIENSAGTELTQRDVMQVLDGLEAVDDSTNQKTKIKMNLPIVSSADWNAMTEQEKTAYKASHYRFGVEVPDTEGVINAEYMKLLWENPNTTQAFPAQIITLNSADYDFLMFQYAPSGNTSVRISQICPKGAAIVLSYSFWYTQGGYTAIRLREIARSSDTVYSAMDAYEGSSVVNNLIIPIAIYGIKKNFQFKVNAIATDLSTRADHCMLSDNETSVEEAIGNITVHREVASEIISVSNVSAFTSTASHTIQKNPEKILSITPIITSNTGGYIECINVNVARVSNFYVAKGYTLTTIPSNVTLKVSLLISYTD